MMLSSPLLSSPAAITAFRSSSFPGFASLTRHTRARAPGQAGAGKSAFFLLSRLSIRPQLENKRKEKNTKFVSHDVPAHQTGIQQRQ